MRYPIAHTLITVAAAALLAACGKPPEAAAPVNAPAAPATATAPAAPALPPSAPAVEAVGPIVHFKANGFSPAWQAELKGDQLSFEVPDFAGPDTTLHTITVTASPYAKGANYAGKDGNVDVVLDLNGKSCDKTGDAREFTATLSYGKATYHGCADGLR